MVDMDEDFRKAGYAAIDRIIEYNRSLAAQPPADSADPVPAHVVSQIAPGYLSKILPGSIPEHGEPLERIQSDLETCIMPGITHWQSPNFMAYFPANSSYPGMLGDMYSDMLTCAAFNWQASPAVTELETMVMDQLGDAIGLGPDFLSQGRGGGVIFGSASESVMTMMIAARDRVLDGDGDGIHDGESAAVSVDQLVVVISDQTHSSVEKGAKLLRLKIHKVTTRKEEEYGMTGTSVASALEKLRAQGLVPFFLCLTLGTTSICAIDDFKSILPIMKPQSGRPDELQEDNGKIWVHLDAAYAGAALILPSHQHYTSPYLALFDSIEMNAHKWLLTNFDCSCLWLRSRRPLIAAMSVDAEYLRNPHSDHGLVTDYRNWGVPLGRRFRALKLWFVFRAYGLSGLREHIEGHLRYAATFERLVRHRDGWTIVGVPKFALCVFKFDAGREVTKEVYEQINAEGKLFLTSSVVDGEFVIRVVGCAPGVTEAHLVGAFNLINRTYKQVMQKKK